MFLAAVDPSTDVWHFRAHPEVWFLVGSLIAAYVYLVRSVGPAAVPAGQPVVTRRNVWSFAAAMAMLWLASDWPMHDLAEQYLYSVHMVQHMILSYFLPPLALLATPEWLLRLLIGDGRLARAVHWTTKPVVAGVVFNLAVMITHIPGVVNASVESGPLHYGLHVLVVVTALLMWMPICGPLPEVRLGPGGTMLYLFAQSFVPTVPAGWLVFADGAVYKVYDHGVRVWGLSVTDDQQLAGAVMKIGGSMFLWTVVTWVFFARFMKGWDESNSFRRVRFPDAEVTGHDDHVLTYDEVTESFDRSPAPVDKP